MKAKMSETDKVQWILIGILALVLACCLSMFLFARPAQAIVPVDLDNGKKSQISIDRGYQVVCEQVDSVKNTSFNPAGYRSSETTIYTLNDGSPAMVYGMVKFRPGIYARSTAPGDTQFVGPMDPNSRCPSTAGLFDTGWEKDQQNNVW